MSISDTLSTTVWEYFEEMLGDFPHDSLRDLPLDSTCGQDCKRCIDVTAELKLVADMADPELGERLVETASEICTIFWRG